MKYQKIIKAEFVQRDHRFIAYCYIKEEIYKVHVRNTGRCRELLLPGTTVYLQDCGVREGRVTRYGLVAVQKGDKLINMDAQAPNQVVKEALCSGMLNIHFPQPIVDLRSEFSYGSSRLDFTAMCGEKRLLLEVKGVTLEENGVAMFPDAPTERGIRHIRELIKGAKDGNLACILFVVQMNSAICFLPNYKTHPAFGRALKEAQDANVQILAYTCSVTPDSMTLKEQIPVEF